MILKVHCDRCKEAQEEITLHSAMGKVLLTTHAPFPVPHGWEVWSVVPDDLGLAPIQLYLCTLCATAVKRYATESPARMQG